MIGSGMILILLSLAAVGPQIAPQDPLVPNLVHKNESPGVGHWLGTDQFGRDILSRILHGARISITLAAGATFLATLAGTPIGLLAGYQRGLLDSIISGAVDILLAFPTYLLAIFIVAILGPTKTNIMAAVGFSTLPHIVRIVRGDTMGVREQDMVLAAQAAGASTSRIMFVHIMPNIVGSLAVVATLNLGTAVLVESSLTFLGIGLSAPTPAWGLMVNEGFQYIRLEPWLVFPPAVAIMITVLGFNLFGDGLRDSIDPRTI